MLKLLTYDSLLAEASEYILSLPETKQKELKENLSHGKALLKSKDQMKAYLHHYGQMHREKLLRAYKHIPSDFLKSSFSVIDWGCGQGLASMVLSEYVPNEDIVTDFILIEPSVLCLSQANANLTWSNPKSMVDVLRKREEEVEATDICVQERKVLHLLSNVVDMPEFSGNGIRRFVFANINLNHLTGRSVVLFRTIEYGNASQRFSGTAGLWFTTLYRNCRLQTGITLVYSQKRLEHDS